MLFCMALATPPDTVLETSYLEMVGVLVTCNQASDPDPWFIHL